MSGTLTGLVGVIGDVHAEDAHLEKALAELAELGAERILCVGDVSDGPGDLDRACALLAEHHVATVRGNHDRWLSDDRMRDLPHAQTKEGVSPATARFLAGLPTTIRFSSQWGGVLLCHGLGPDDMRSVLPDDDGYAIEFNTELQILLADPAVQVVINGHTHQPMVRHFDGLTVVNAGTLFRMNVPGYLVMDFATGQVEWRSLTTPTRRALGTIAPG